MSIKIMSLVWEHYPTGGGELLTALAYADHAHDDGTSIRPSIAYMARKTRQSERTIQMHLVAMRRAEWMLTVRHAAGGRGRATEYRINPAWIANPAEFAPFIDLLKRVQERAKRGAIDGTKGRKAFSPQSPRTINEPTTTGVTGTEGDVGGSEKLKWPDNYRRGCRPTVRCRPRPGARYSGWRHTGILCRNGGSKHRIVPVNGLKHVFVRIALGTVAVQSSCLIDFSKIR